MGGASVSQASSELQIHSSIGNRWNNDARRAKAPKDAFFSEHSVVCRRFAQLIKPSELSIRLNESREFCEWHFEAFLRGRVSLRELVEAPPSRAQQRYQSSVDSFHKWTAENAERKAKRKIEKLKAAKEASLIRQIASIAGTTARRIPGLIGYFATSCGRIFSIRKGKVRELVPRRNERGFFRVRVTVDGKEVRRAVHILVWEAFRGQRNGGRIVFVDGNRMNCCIKNLEILSRSEYESRRPRHFSRELKIDDATASIIRSDSQSTDQELAKRFGVVDTYINRIRNGRRRQHVNSAHH